MKYKKTLSELQKVAINWWPKELEAEVTKLSVVPKLLETQELFVSALKLSGNSPEQIFDVISAGSIAPNLFLKHLIVLADYGGEPIKRLGSEFSKIFPISKTNPKPVLEYTFKGKTFKYVFNELPTKGLGNKKLSIDGDSIVKPRALDGLLKDMIMLLLHGATSPVSDLASLERCDLGGLLGNAPAIDKYVREKYIYVSRITTGASANSLGQIAQVYVADFLRNQLAILDDDYIVQSNGKIKLKGYDKTDGMPFDVVITRKKKIVGVEVSFQVTSNSVIERKAALAENRLNLMRHDGHFIAYVLDGAGNFSRTAALETLCQSSDCTVAYSDAELLTLVDFIRGKLDDSIR